MQFAFRFNQFFQTQQVVITDLHDMVVTMYKEILLCFMQRNYVMQNDNKQNKSK